MLSFLDEKSLHRIATLQKTATHYAIMELDSLARSAVRGMSDEVTPSLLDKERSVIIPSSRDQVRPSDLSQQPTPWILVTMLSETNDHCDIIVTALFAPPSWLQRKLYSAVEPDSIGVFIRVSRAIEVVYHIRLHHHDCQERHTLILPRLLATIVLSDVTGEPATWWNKEDTISKR
jgi:hypothetical protein